MTAPAILLKEESNLQSVMSLYYWFALNPSVNKPILVSTLEGYLCDELEKKSFRL